MIRNSTLHTARALRTATSTAMRANSTATHQHADYKKQGRRGGYDQSWIIGAISVGLLGSVLYWNVYGRPAKDGGHTMIERPPNRHDGRDQRLKDAKSE